MRRLGQWGLRHLLGGSKAKVQGHGPTFSHWLALLSPAGRNILNSVKNNKHGLININRPGWCQKKRERTVPCWLLLPGPCCGCQLLNHLETAGRLPWPHPRPGQAKARPGQAQEVATTGSSATGQPGPGPPFGWTLKSIPACSLSGSPWPMRQNLHTLS